MKKQLIPTPKQTLLRSLRRGDVISWSNSSLHDTDYTVKSILIVIKTDASKIVARNISDSNRFNNREAVIKLDRAFPGHVRLESRASLSPDIRQWPASMRHSLVGSSDKNSLIKYRANLVHQATRGTKRIKVTSESKKRRSRRKKLARAKKVKVDDMPNYQGLLISVKLINKICCRVYKVTGKPSAHVRGWFTLPAPAVQKNVRDASCLLFVGDANVEHHLLDYAYMSFSKIYKQAGVELEDKPGFDAVNKISEENKLIIPIQLLMSATEVFPRIMYPDMWSPLKGSLAPMPSADWSVVEPMLVHEAAPLFHYEPEAPLFHDEPGDYEEPDYDDYDEDEDI